MRSGLRGLFRKQTRSHPEVREVEARFVQLSRSLIDPKRRRLASRRVANQVEAQLSAAQALLPKRDLEYGRRTPYAKAKESLKKGDPFLKLIRLHIIL